MNYESDSIKNAHLNEYYEACEQGDLGKVKTLMVKLEIKVSYYINRHAIVCAAKKNHLPVLEYFLNEFKNDYDSKIQKSTLDSQSYPLKDRSFKESLYGYMIDSFRDSMVEVCTKGYLDILRFYIDFLGDIPNINDFEKCAKLSCENGHFQMTQYLLETPKAQDFIDQKKYYNSILPTTNVKANDTIKYFLDSPNYVEKIKLLKLLESAYYDNNGEIIEYLIIDKNMLYSKKVKQKVENWTNKLEREYNIPKIFKNREIYLLAKKLEEIIPQKIDNASNNKFKI